MSKAGAKNIKVLHSVADERETEEWEQMCEKKYICGSELTLDSVPAVGAYALQAVTV